MGTLLGVANHVVHTSAISWRVCEVKHRQYSTGVRELLEEPDDHYLLFGRLGLIKKTALSEYVRINRNGKYALRFKKEGDSLVNVRSATNEHDIVMISTTGYASRFNCGAIRASGRVSGGVYGIKVSDRKGSGGGVVAGMVAMLSADEHILTISKYGMAKRSRLVRPPRFQTRMQR